LQQSAACDTTASAFRARGGRLAIFVPKHNSVDLQARLSAIPRTGLPLDYPLTVRWNEHQVPFIEAETDHDLAVGLGVVHVHLRWAQIEMMRHVVYGRISELIGPFGLRMDRTLRVIGLTHAVPAIVAQLPAETRHWLDAFVAGMNVAIERLPAVPPEFRWLGLRRSPWSVEDVVALIRLAGIDVTWMVWLALLPNHKKAQVADLWQRLMGEDATFDLGDTRETSGLAARLHAMLMRYGRVGSNSWAVAPERSASGGAWLANDTHLSALLPNLWLLAGYRSPSFHATGLMVPGIPAILVGRNPTIAWGGTNLHAASSDVFDISGVPDSEIDTRKERIKLRYGGYRTITVRHSKLGPIISDLPQLSGRGAQYALRWMGHQPSDEISGLMAMNRAKNWDEFHTALNSIGVPGQNILYADTSGHIGKAMAVHLPQRPVAPASSPLLPKSAAAAWDTVLRSTDLPHACDPHEGFLASANNRPAESPVLVGYFFSANMRIDRLNDLLRQTNRHDKESLAAMQRDVVVPGMLPTRDRLVALLRARRTPDAERLAEPLSQWDGTYDAQSATPLIFELLLYHLNVALHGKRMLKLYSSVWNTRGLLAHDMERMSPSRLLRALRTAEPKVVRDVRRFRTWGAMHRLEPRHVMAIFPLLGQYFRFGDWATSGSSDAVMKTGHGLTSRRHHASLASTARHISDLSDIDGNWFVLLGGQDGWIGSTTLLDQTTLWQEGRYIQMPLSPDGVEQYYPRRMELTP
jgi:penicillin G amidase